MLYLGMMAAAKEKKAKTSETMNVWSISKRIEVFRGQQTTVTHTVFLCVTVYNF